MRSRGRTEVLLLLGAALAAAPVAVPAGAQAATAEIVGDTAVYTASPGELNILNASSSAANGSAPAIAAFRDEGAPITVGAGCTPAAWPRDYVRCQGPIARVRIDLGDQNDGGDVNFGASTDGLPAEIDGGPGDDQVFGGGPGAHVLGGTGRDELRGGGGNDVLEPGPGLWDSVDAGGGDDRVIGGPDSETLVGGPGDDVIDGNEGMDRLDGDAGDDVLRGGPGPDSLVGDAGDDLIEGGADVDSVMYDDRAEPVRAVLDGVGPDGAAGENDSIGADVESVVGGRGDDVLVGDGGTNTINGGPGDDTISGGGGEDALGGDDGNDTLDGGTEADMLAGGQGNDTLDGGAGWDHLAGEEGADRLVGRDPDGATVYADVVRCGPSRDEAWTDAVDDVAGCETVNGAPGAPPASGPGNWRPATQLNERGTGSFPASVVVTSLGETVAAWGDYVIPDQFPMRLNTEVRDPSGSLVAREQLASSLNAPDPLAAAGADGGALVTWRWGDTFVASRPSGGPFGAPVTLPDGVGQPVPLTNRRGDAAVLYDADRRWYAVLHPRGGDWSAPVAVTPPLDDNPYGRAAVLTEAGDIRIVFQVGFFGDTPILAGGRLADGTMLPLQQLSSTGVTDSHIQLGVDDAGNAVALWYQRVVGANGTSYVNRLADAPPGGAFGAPYAIPGTTGREPPGALAVDSAGRVTVATAGDGSLIFLSGRTGEPLRVLRRVDGVQPVLATSRSGRLVAAWSADYEHWLTMRRDGDDPFGEIEDLEPACARAESVSLAVNDQGFAAAALSRGGVQSLTQSGPTALPPARDCVDARFYKDFVPWKPTSPPPPTTGPWIGWPTPSQQGPPKPPSAMRVTKLRLLGSGGRRKASFTVDCGTSCTVESTVRLSDAKGRALGSATLRRRKVKKPTTFTVALVAPRAKKGVKSSATKPVSAARLDTRTVATYAGGRRVVRKLAARVKAR